MTGPGYTRRHLGRWAAATFGTSILSGPGAVLAAPAVDGLIWDQPRSRPTVERRYRADAQVLLMSLPLFHRSAVGGGSVVWSNWRDANGNSFRHLEFLGYSLPERTAGLNRLGFIRELARSNPNDAGEAIYFGLMTASNEATAEEAKAALDAKNTEVPYSAIEGRIAQAGVSTTSAHFMGPAKITADRRAELIEMARKALAAGEHSEAQPQNSPPFLNALADALNGPEQTESRYLYSGRAYRLWIRKTIDSKSTDYFQERRLIPSGVKVIRASGRLRRESGGKETDFRLWVADNDPRKLPLRIEYQPKSFLRLTFEAES